MKTRTSLSLMGLAAITFASLISMATNPAKAAPPPAVDVLIQFKQVPGDMHRGVVVNAGGVIRHSYKIVPAIAARVSQAALLNLMKNPAVVLIEPDMRVQAIDAELDAVWGVKRIGTGIVNGAYTGAGINVAVIDSGVDYSHPDLQANIKGGYDFVNGDPNPWDDNGHGTHIAGTIAAVDDNLGIVGVAPRVNLYALKVLDATGGGSFSDVIAALDWCVTNKMDITNNSYGSSGDPGSIVQNAFINARAAGILNIAAAGNSGNADGTGDNVDYPAKYLSVVAVGATTKTDSRASFSSTGPDVEVAAPGSGIYSTVPGGGYESWSGTSMACPHAVGTAAVLLEAGRHLYGSAATNDYVRAKLSSSAQDLGTVGIDSWFGAGLVRVDYGVESVVATSPIAPTLKMTVSSIRYATSGPRKRDLIVTVLVVNQSGVAVAGASVNAAITCTATTTTYGGNATTDSTGKAVYKIASAPRGTWTTKVNGVTKSGYTWDGRYPANSFLK